MKKRILEGFLLFTMLVIPNSVFASSIEIENTDIYGSTYQYYKMISGVLTYEGATDEDYHVKLDKDNNKLYLNNFITDEEIYTDLEELNIILEGVNEVTSNDSNAIYSLGDIIFSGNGSIDIEGDSNGIKSEKKVIINDGTINVNGVNYNGIEAYQIEINGGLVNAKGGYSGIHTQSNGHGIDYDDSFKMTGGNLFAVSGMSTAINSMNKEYDNCIVVIDNNGNIDFKMYGNATLLQDLELETDVVIPSGSVLTIPEGVTLKLKDQNQLKLNGSIILLGDMFVGDKEYFNISIKETDNGTIKTTYNIALENEEVNLTVTPNSLYNLSSLTYINSNTKEKVNITDNKFLMPSSDVTIEGTFTKKEIIENPDTGDNIGYIFLLVGLSLVGLIVITICIFKNKK